MHRDYPARTADSIDTMEALDQVLREEREALRTGDLSRLVRLTEAKDALISSLESQAVSDRRRHGEDAHQQGLVRLQRQLAENAVLLKSARAGLGSAIARTKERRRVAGHLDVYTRRGTRQDLPTGRSRIDSRA